MVMNCRSKTVHEVQCLRTKDEKIVKVVTWCGLSMAIGPIRVPPEGTEATCGNCKRAYKQVTLPDLLQAVMRKKEGE